MRRAWMVLTVHILQPPEISSCCMYIYLLFFFIESSHYIHAAHTTDFQHILPARKRKAQGTDDLGAVEAPDSQLIFMRPRMIRQKG